MNVTESEFLLETLKYSLSRYYVEIHLFYMLQYYYKHFLVISEIVRTSSKLRSHKSNCTLPFKKEASPTVISSVYPSHVWIWGYKRCFPIDH